MKLGFFSPLPPSPTGVADYSEALLRQMRKSGDVIANSPGDVNLYHIGNNHLHREIYARALAERGVVLLHDAVLQHFFLGTLTEAGYVEEFVFNYGEWTRDLAKDLWKNRARSAADPRYFQYPMLKRIVTASRAVIVHNPGAAETVRRHSGTNVFEIPHLFLSPLTPPAEEVFALREKLGVAPGALLAGVFGHLRESKRLTVVLRAIERLWRTGSDARLLVQGEFASTDLERAVRAKLKDPRIVRAGFLTPTEFWRYAAATDLCINLRYPSAGETSGIAISMMGIGKAVIFTSGAEIARFPENACLKVDFDPAEEEHLAGLIGWVDENRAALLKIGARARAHILAAHDGERVAGLFWDVVKSF